MASTVREREARGRARADAPSVGADSGRARALLRLLRPRQWIKNAFVLAPVLFAGLHLDGDAVARGVLAALLFSLAASSVYVLNDLVDLPRDRLHPAKRHRPLAAGTISKREAWLLLGALCAVLLAGLPLLPAAAGAIGLYLALNLAYSAGLKRVPVVDLFCLALGFVLRVWAGALAVGVPLSSWMLITTLALALYLSAIKRRQEFLLSGADGRAILASYSVALLDRYAEMAATCTIVFYSLYVLEVQPGLTVSIPLVLFGIYRYWYIVERLDGGESPTDVLYSDLPLILSILAWGALAFHAML